jgi:hypothetical protein
MARAGLGETMKTTKNAKRASRRAEPPCSASCEKCGGTDIYRRHRRKGDKWNKVMGDMRQWETAHVAYDTYSCEARRECLTHNCRTCGYEWTTDIHKPNATAQGREASPAAGGSQGDRL